MTDLPDDLRRLVERPEPKETGEPEEWLWVFDPVNDEVHLHENDSLHPAHYLHHKDLHGEVDHPSRTEGYAYPIKGGWRITNDDHKAVEDPHVLMLVHRALLRESRQGSPQDHPAFSHQPDQQ